MSVPKDYITFSHCVSFRLLLNVITSHTFIVFDTMTVLSTIIQVFCRRSLNLSYSAIALMIKLGLWFLGRKTTEIKCHFITSWQGYYPQHGISLLILTLITWLRLCLSRFSTAKLSSSPLPHIGLFARKLLSTTYI